MSSRATHSLQNGDRSFGLLITTQLLCGMTETHLIWCPMTLAGYKDPEKLVIAELSVKVSCWWIKDEVRYPNELSDINKPQNENLRHLVMAGDHAFYFQKIIISLYISETTNRFSLNGYRWRKVVERTERGRMATYLCSLRPSGRDNIFMGVNGVQGGWLNYSAGGRHYAAEDTDLW